MPPLPQTKAGWIGYGWGTVEVSANDVPMDRAQVAQRLVRVIDDPAWRPPVLPDVAARLVEMTRRSTVGIAEVAQVLMRDATLAAQLMRRANSAMYAGTGKVQTVRDAAARVGLDGVRNVALEIAMSMRIFRAEGYQPIADALRVHSVATAHLSSLVCRYTPMPAAQAFLCGLLADVGLAVGLMVLGEGGRNQRRPDLSYVWPSLVEIHEALSARVAKHWNLDDETVMVLANHHKLRVGNVVHPLAAVVLVGSSLAEALGHPFPSPPDATAVPMDHLAGPAREALGLSERQMELLAVEGQRLLHDIAL